MSALMLNFGDIFRYEIGGQEDEYVYFIEINGIRYAAKILDQANSRELDRASERQAKIDRDGRYDTLYCFVMLTTPEYKDRAALVGFCDNNDGFDDGWHEPIGKVSDEDVKFLLQKIKESKGVPKALQDYANSIQ